MRTEQEIYRAYQLIQRTARENNNDPLAYASHIIAKAMFNTLAWLAEQGDDPDGPNKSFEKMLDRLEKVYGPVAELPHARGNL